MKLVKCENTQFDSVDFDNLVFGKVFADYMLVSDYTEGTWSELSIEPMKPIEMHPATSVLHYGQAIFEGLKAYKNDEGKVNIFRLKDNISRLNASAERMQMPQLPEDLVLEAIKKFVEIQKHWVPRKDQGTMYIRPFMIASEPALKAVPSLSYKFMVIACPVGFYYNTPLNILLEKNFRRAATGGVGFAKAAGNYAASFYPTQLAKDNGFDQILWTDITNDNTLEELGSANFFYVKNGVIYTPSLRDSILKGITRDTIIQLAKSNGLEIHEREIKASDIKEDLSSGNVDCMFATGTAVAITYVNSITIDDEKYTVDSVNYTPITQLKQMLDDARFLQNSLHPEWNVEV